MLYSVWSIIITLALVVRISTRSTLDAPNQSNTRLNPEPAWGLIATGAAWFYPPPCEQSIDLHPVTCRSSGSDDVILAGPGDRCLRGRRALLLG